GARERHAIRDAGRGGASFEIRPQRTFADDDQAPAPIDVRERVDDELDAFVAFEPPDREEVIAVRSALQLSGQRRRMVERLRPQSVVSRDPFRGVARVAEDRAGLAERLRVELDEPIAQPHVGGIVRELAVRRAAEIVDRAVLVEEPGDLAGMPDEVGGKLRRDREVDALAVRFAHVEHLPGGHLRQQFLLRIPLEGNRDALDAIPAPAEVVDQSARVQLGAAVHERHLGLADDDGPDHVAWRKLMMSPSTTMYSLPSRRTSP